MLLISLIIFQYQNLMLYQISFFSLWQVIFSNPITKHPFLVMLSSVLIQDLSPNSNVPSLAQEGSCKKVARWILICYLILKFCDSVSDRVDVVCVLWLIIIVAWLFADIFRLLLKTHEILHLKKLFKSCAKPISLLYPCALPCYWIYLLVWGLRTGSEREWNSISVYLHYWMKNKNSAF